MQQLWSRHVTIVWALRFHNLSHDIARTVLEYTMFELVHPSHILPPLICCNIHDIHVPVTFSLDSGREVKCPSRGTLTYDASCRVGGFILPLDTLIPIQSLDALVHDEAFESQTTELNVHVGGQVYPYVHVLGLRGELRALRQCQLVVMEENWYRIRYTLVKDSGFVQAFPTPRQLEWVVLRLETRPHTVDASARLLRVERKITRQKARLAQDASTELRWLAPY